jgi:hypothetical protein
MNIQQIVIVLLISLFSSSIANAEFLKEGSGDIANAEFLKEGSGDYMGEVEGTSKFINMGGGRYQTTWDVHGIITSAPKDSPFYNAKSHFIGTTHVIDDSFKSNGGGVFTTPNGDTFYGISEAEGSVSGGIRSGIITVLGGSGECVYMKGEMILSPRPSPTTDKESGTFHGISKGKLKWKMFYGRE